ncbi:MAG: 30S ribosomal protein S6 [Oscillospiraceae bacterium]
MAKLNENYEAIIVFSMKQGEETVKALNEKFTTLIQENGTIEKVDEWGKRMLAYPINDENEGFYVLYHFNSVPSFPVELDRKLKITDGILRSLIVTRV